MSRVCPVTGKGPLSGNNRSHSLRATRRVQNPNLQKFKLNVNGKMITVRLSARGYRTLMKAQKAKTKKVATPKAEAKAPATEAAK
ncbi:MAG: 50S ribosomal protein L28 [Bacilli bacterium]|nr:50S ribosomal protein L28 [Bacilli bacterium]